MSRRYRGGFITANPVAPTTSAASGTWTLEQQMQNAGNWPAPPILPGQQAYTTPGTYSWTAPATVTSVCVVCVGGGGFGWTRNDGGGGGGGGGGLGWKNNIPVVPGTSYTVVVGAGGVSAASLAGDSYFISLATVAGLKGSNTTGGTDAYFNVNNLGGSYVGDGGGNGGSGGAGYNSDGSASGGGAGAGGYTGNGGNGAGKLGGRTNGSGGGGAGGNGGGGEGIFGAGGGGVGILGAGASGSSSGAGGSSGSNSTNQNGALYGGSGGGAFAGGSNSTGSGGAVRIIWGTTVTRAFPSTNTGNL